jgi:Xaa-Pro aminopeptidase
MVIVVQPNVVTTDHRMGVQVGDMLRVTATGVESFHSVPREILRCG